MKHALKKRKETLSMIHIRTDILPTYLETERKTDRQTNTHTII